MNMTTDYMVAIEELKNTFKELCKYDENIEIQNRVMQMKAGAIKNLLKSADEKIYQGCATSCFYEKKNAGYELKLLKDYDASIEKVDIDRIIRELKQHEMFNELDSLSNLLEEKGYSDLAAECKNNKYYNIFLKIKTLIESYLDTEITDDYKEKYHELMKKIKEIEE